MEAAILALLFLIALCAGAIALGLTILVLAFIIDALQERLK